MGLFFLASFLTLGAMFWPSMIPYSVTAAEAAAPDAALPSSTVDPLPYIFRQSPDCSKA